MSENITQVKVTMTDPSRLPMAVDGLRPKKSAVSANPKLINAEIKKYRASFSP